MITAAVIGVAGSAYASNRASSASDRATDAASDAEQARLDFEMEQWDEWQATYGNVEDQLAAYYETLTPTFRATQGLEAHEKEMNRMKKNVRETLDQRGIGTSGIAAQFEMETSISSAEERARIRAAAPLEVAREKLGFLQTGLGMQPQAGMRDALGDATLRTAQDARTAARNAGAASGAFIGSLGDLAQAGFTRWMNRGSTDSGDDNSRRRW